MIRRELYCEGKSKRFWFIELEGKTYTVSYGLVGGAGQTRSKEFKTEDQAYKAYEKQVAEKISQGYFEIPKITSEPLPSAPAATELADSQNLIDPDISGVESEITAEELMLEATAEASGVTLEPSLSQLPVSLESTTSPAATVEVTPSPVLGWEDEEILPITFTLDPRLLTPIEVPVLSPLPIAFPSYTPPSSPLPDPEPVVPVSDPVRPKWWLNAVQELETKGPIPLPDWLTQEPPPPLTIENYDLSSDELQVLLRALTLLQKEYCPLLIQEIKTRLDPAQLHQLDLFADWILRHWTTEPTRDTWVFLALELWGGERVALQLNSRIQAWSDQYFHDAAAAGLHCLYAIGSPLALLQIIQIQHYSPYSLLGIQAQEYLEQVAHSWGTTRLRVEDQLMFDLGGSVTSSQHLDWILPIPKQRLERAMLFGQRWTESDFRAYLLASPFLAPLAEQLVWAAYDATGQPICSFAPAGGEYLDPHGTVIPTGIFGSVQVLHPVLLVPSQIQEWQAYFQQQGLSAPFPQLDRQVFRPRLSEQQKTAITDFQSSVSFYLAFLPLLKPRGWTWLWGTQSLAKTTKQCFKPYPNHQVTAVLELVEGYTGKVQLLKHCFFVKGLHPEVEIHYTQALPLAQVDPVVFSETLWDIHLLLQKGAVPEKSNS
jgi:predicted DNA-binding WGR domain protein